MTVVGLGFLIGGLVLGVFAMLYGTERSVRNRSVSKPHERRSEHDPATEPSPFFNLATVGAFSVAFGLTAYLVARHTLWSLAAQVVVSLLAGGVAMWLQSLLIGRWAIPAARAEHIDERFLLQGTLARVVETIPTEGAGRVSYALDGHQCVLSARDIDDANISAGTDVVIDRVEGGVAYVERWARVEQRL